MTYADDTAESQRLQIEMNRREALAFAAVKEAEAAEAAKLAPEIARKKAADELAWAKGVLAAQGGRVAERQRAAEIVAASQSEA
jgi:hypothetical protein